MRRLSRIALPGVYSDPTIYASLPVNRKLERVPAIASITIVRLMLKTLLALMLLVAQANAFSLLGPYADWMHRTNSFRLDDIGGPMNLGEEYRWNVPVLTYAFDRSFLNYFGTNGVAAVESAMSVLNGLPPASQVNPSNYPPHAGQFNFNAQGQRLLDLKSAALAFMLENLGLAQPTRFAFCLHDFSFVNGAFVGTVVQRNFDPTTLVISSNVNNTLYSYYFLHVFSSQTNYDDAVEIPVNGTATTFTAVADREVSPGQFITGLTFDDVGGLRYLLSTNNANLEILLPNVHGVGPNAGSYANQAIRPGIEKITFVRPAYDSLLGQFFTPFTNQFTDRYVTNNIMVEQQVERITQQPDFVFSSGDSTELGGRVVARTGTSNWWNSGSPSLDGPGLIRPPVTITFGRWSIVQTDDHFPEAEAYVENLRWGSFDGSTNLPVTYPIGSFSSADLTIQLSVIVGRASRGTFTWQLPVASGEAADLQTSTNLLSWDTLTTLTNQGAPFYWYHVGLGPQRYFRVLPQ